MYIGNFLRRFSIVWSLTFSIVFISCESNSIKDAVPEDSAKIEANGITLTLGSVSNQIQHEVLTQKPFAEFLEDSLHKYGVSHVNLLVTRSLDEMLSEIDAGNIDLYFDSPYPAKISTQSSKLELFLKLNKAGVEKYHSVIFTTASSGINSLDDLLGKIIGFEKKYSTSGYHLPLKEIRNAGYKTKELFSIDEEVPKDVIGYIMTGDDENTMFWVFENRIAAGATDNISINQFSGLRNNELKILVKTADVPRYLVMVRSGLTKEIKNAVQNIMLNMHSSERGINVLHKFYGTTCFDTLSEKDVAIIEEL